MRRSRLHRGFISPFRNVVIISREKTDFVSHRSIHCPIHLSLTYPFDKFLSPSLPQTTGGFCTGKLPGWELDRLIGQTDSKGYIFGLNSNEDRLGSHCTCPWV